ncbi:hypothetical protein PASE110613_15415 [Paenibacillus sediminis]|uniref:Uncharacterized protein n=1 Tax=Paenibacillus sediminis TaxID=664909 RepID=A0ABS4H7K1_9BACL|nr:hypothetical protein [Paenibacillus sediminis]MBP1938227.1 hypothetical protein [Paenibacillus sediminis]
MKKLIKDEYYDFYLYGEKEKHIVEIKNIKVGSFDDLSKLLSQNFCSIFNKGQRLIFPIGRVYQINQTIIKVCEACKEELNEKDLCEKCLINGGE